MTDKERIAKLEAEVALLREMVAKMAAANHSPVYVYPTAIPLPQPQPWEPPFKITWGGPAFGTTSLSQ